MSRHPIGSGPFKFVSAETDKEVIIERNEDYWGDKAKLARVRFAIVPDATTQALELRKGSGDVIINGSFPPDTVLTLKRESSLAVESAPGTRLAYLGFNLRDPILKDVQHSPGHCLCSRSPAHDRLSVARRSAAGAQRTSAAKLGLQR